MSLKYYVELHLHQRFYNKKRPENLKTLKAYKCDKSEKCIKKSFFIYAVIITSKSQLWVCL